MKKSIFFKTTYLLLILIIITIDTISKKWVVMHVKLHKTFHINSFLNFFYTYNYGMAFNFLSNFSKEFQRWFLSSISCLIIFMIFLVMMNCQKIFKKTQQIAYSIIIGGGLSNVFDRIYHGYVIDFIDIKIIKFHIPTFNIADLSIFIGLLIILTINFFIIFFKLDK
ncbi:signal peptidase II [Candidatus Tachikawaea gelatinosa]|uniref:Lipoprotein signal peptidase n=1 Tax=Candidatus Tachikawaea gelatinosa TaxID=1410383 RepID=A0A090AR30_9ENTR|nr:signal peptidase II [Candidatus Tachikawaea gelatinosa]BAP58797.1 lipoprotein signal peptidase [Candidatus Tachikawaea gelatinosa]